MTSTSPVSERSRKPAEKNVDSVVLGDLLVEAWYRSSYPQDLIGSKLDRLYVCHACFRYSKDLMPFVAHTKVCPRSGQDPPGSLIYKDGDAQIYEMDGEEHKLYAQNLSLFAKLFLDTKSVFYDVTTFRYYLMTIHDPISGRRQVVGFFSKEKMSWDSNNLACILVFPPWQRRGLGQILMGTSYELSRQEGRLGGPEKPLSSLGRKAYQAYWSAAIARFMLGTSAKRVSVREIVSQTGILPEDVVATLGAMKVVDATPQAPAEASVSRERLERWVKQNRVGLAPSVSSEAFVSRAVVDQRAGMS